MSVSSADLVIAYPEFAVINAEDPAYVSAVVAIAERRVGPSWSADVRPDIVMLQAAHQLALSPMGRNAKLSNPGEPTAYQAELDVRKKAFAYSRSRVV